MFNKNHFVEFVQVHLEHCKQLTIHTFL